MGALATAGVISGAGNAGTAALSTAQSGMQAAAIDAERNRLENERLKMHLESNERLQQAVLGSHEKEGVLNREQAKELQSNQQQFLTGQKQADIGADIVKQSGIDKLAARKLGLEEQHYKDWKEVYTKIADARGQLAGIRTTKEQLNPAVKARVDARMKLLEGKLKIVEELKKQGSDPSDVEDEVNTILGDIDNLVTGVVPKAKSSTYKEMFPDLPATAPGAALAAPAPSASPGLLNTPPPNPNAPRQPVEGYNRTPLWQKP